MQNQILSCCVCYAEFDQTLHAPKLISCGHTICLSCLSHILNMNSLPKCPLDRQAFDLQPAAELFPTNMIVAQLLDSKLDNEICVEHEGFKNYVCLTDQCRVCKYCADHGSHKGHEIKHFSEIKSQVREKVTVLEGIKQEFEKDYKSTTGLFDDNEKAMLEIVNESCASMKKLLDDAFQKICLEIELTFQSQKLKMQHRLKNDFKQKKAIQNKISNLEKLSIAKPFFDAFYDEHVGEFDIKTEYKDAENFVQNINTGKFKENFKFLETSISALLKEIHLGFSVDLSSFFKLEKDNDWLIFSPAKMNKKFIPDESLKQIEWKKNQKIGFVFNDGQPSQAFLQSMQYVWQQIESVTDIDLDFSTSELTDGDLDDLLSNSLWKSENLKVFALNLYQCESLTDQGLRKVMKETIGNMKGLKKLYLDLGETGITNKSLKNLAKTALPKLTELETFGLHLYKTQTADGTIGELCENLMNVIKKIKTFEITLSSTRISDKSVSILTEVLFPNMFAIENLEIYLYGTQVSNTGIKKLSEGFKGITTKLKTLNLSLGKTRANDQGIVQLFKNLKHISENIEDFNLSVEETSITDEGLKVFIQDTLPVMKSVKHFALSLNSTGITDESIKNLCKGLKDGFDQVETFRLNLEKTEITNLSIQMLAGYVIRIMKDLQDLEFNFKGTKITDIQELCLSMGESLNSLKYCELDFGNTLISDNSATSLMSYLESIQRPVKSIVISLEGTLVSEDNMTNVTKAIERVLENNTE